MFDLYVHGTALKIFFNLWDEAVKSKASSITESLWSFLSISVFPSSTPTFSGSEVGFLINPPPPPLLLRSAWQSFKSLEGTLVKLYFGWTLLFLNSASLLRWMLGVERDTLKKYFHLFYIFIAASVVDIIVLRMSCYFPWLDWKAQINQAVLRLG